MFWIFVTLWILDICISTLEALLLGCTAHKYSHRVYQYKYLVFGTKHDRFKQHVRQTLMTFTQV